jgi:hypothetical protein
MAAIENPPTTTINRPVMIVSTLVMMSMGTSRGRYRQIPSGTPPLLPGVGSMREFGTLFE